MDPAQPFLWAALVQAAGDDFKTHYERFVGFGIG
jgi:hypothetical protein